MAVDKPGRCAELPVLFPEIALQDFGRGQERENRRIALGKLAAIVFLTEGRPGTAPTPAVPATASPPLMKERLLVARFIPIAKFFIGSLLCVLSK